MMEMYVTEIIILVIVIFFVVGAVMTSNHTTQEEKSAWAFSTIIMILWLCSCFVSILNL